MGGKPPMQRIGVNLEYLLQRFNRQPALLNPIVPAERRFSDGMRAGT